MAVGVLVLHAATMLSMPTHGHAQTVVEVGAWASDHAGLQGDGTGVFGAALTVTPGPLGLRGSVGVSRVGGPLSVGSLPEGAASNWFADLDAVLRLPVAPLQPYMFAGIGTEGRTEVRRARDGNWSFGGGVSVLPVHWLGIHVEARSRRALSGPATAAGAEGWEFRAGANVRIGAGRAADRQRGPADRGPRRSATRGRTRAEALYARLGRVGNEPGDPGDFGAPEDDIGEAPSYTRSSGSRATLASSVIDHGEQYLGVRYRWGGQDPEYGFDCSGFVQTIYRSQGVALPRVSRDQARSGSSLPLDIDTFVAGDLLFFASSGSRVDHVAVYVGDGTILHSSSSGGGVRYDRLDTSRGNWFVRHLVSARRVL